ncbi:MAG: cytochrome b-c1 complex subunit 10 [Benjaminiella poitrasii]|nr:MAG: cytochrome b-c1 complex subunit 10 [Benjaminiella poitrasii]
MVVSQIHTEPHFKFVSASKVFRATPSLAVWGAAAAAGLALFALDVPIVRKDVLNRLPMVGRYFPVQEVHIEEE